MPITLLTLLKLEFGLMTGHACLSLLFIKCPDQDTLKFKVPQQTVTSTILAKKNVVACAER